MKDGDMRLANGTSANEGRVEIFYGGQWGTVCDNLWDLTDASVVCRALGFKNATEAPGRATFGPGRPACPRSSQAAHPRKGPGTRAHCSHTLGRQCWAWCREGTPTPAHSPRSGCEEAHGHVPRDQLWLFPPAQKPHSWEFIFLKQFTPKRKICAGRFPQTQWL